MLQLECLELYVTGAAFVNKDRTQTKATLQTKKIPTWSDPGGDLNVPETKR